MICGLPKFVLRTLTYSNQLCYIYKMFQFYVIITLANSKVFNSVMLIIKIISDSYYHRHTCKLTLVCKCLEINPKNVSHFWYQNRNKRHNFRNIRRDDSHWGNFISCNVDINNYSFEIHEIFLWYRHVKRPTLSLLFFNLHVFSFLRFLYNIKQIP